LEEVFLDFSEAVDLRVLVWKRKKILTKKKETPIPQDYMKFLDYNPNVTQA
jgi:hypothetical protein